MAKPSSDIFMSTKPEQMSNIASGVKNHEYRGYILPSSVRRIWFYTTTPVKRLEYIGHISPGNIPGQVAEDGGIGNADFNAGRNQSKYGYEILQLWRLWQPISLEQAITTGILRSAPQKYCWVSCRVLQSHSLDRQDLLISKLSENFWRSYSRVYIDRYPDIYIPRYIYSKYIYRGFSTPNHIPRSTSHL